MSQWIKEIGWDCDREATRHGGLGAYLSPSVSVKDRFAVRPHVMLNACLTLSWSDKSFRPRSQVAQLRSGPGKWKCADWSKDDSGSGLGWIFVGSGSLGFSFGAYFSPTVLRVRIPEIPRVWGGSQLSLHNFLTIPKGRIKPNSVYCKWMAYLFVWFRKLLFAWCEGLVWFIS